MTDRVYPSKPTTAAATTTTNPSFPATKAQLYNASRPTYRPMPPPRRRRSCCCSCCLFITLVILLLLLAGAATGAIFYVLYRPHRPTFSLSSLQISQFNLTSSSHLTTRFNLTVTAKNPNKKITFFYDPITVLITSDSDGLNLGNGSLPSFTHGTKNTTTLRTTISTTGQSLDTQSATLLNSDLKNKNGLKLKIRLDTKVRVKIGSLRTNKVSVRVYCTGIKANIPAGRSPAPATTSAAKCKVDLRIKIWKWTV